MNVELFRMYPSFVLVFAAYLSHSAGKPPSCVTGRQWAEYIYRARIKGARTAKVVVLLFDSAPRVPEVKDLCHLDRNTKKRKRGGFVPLDFKTKINDGVLPDWKRLTGSKHVLPAVWNYLISTLKTILSEDQHNTKTVLFDTPFNPHLSSKWSNLDGSIHLGWAGDVTGPSPQHLYGEGDLKTLAWAKVLLKDWKIGKILVMSTDLDNIPIFSRPEYKGVYMVGNAVYINEYNVVVPRCTKPQKAPQAKSAYEVINLGRIPDLLGPTWPFFISVLTMSKNDFQHSIHKLTTDRMMKGYLFLRKTAKPLDAERILSDRQYYLRFVGCCCGNKASKRPMKPPIMSKDQIEAYLARSRWIRKYWDGEEENRGGPDCTRSNGWRRPKLSGENASLEEYGGKVRLVRA